MKDFLSAVSMYKTSTTNKEQCVNARHWFPGMEL
jgi:hypothetical protein